MSEAKPQENGKLAPVTKEELRAAYLKSERSKRALEYAKVSARRAELDLEELLDRYREEKKYPLGKGFNPETWEPI